MTLQSIFQFGDTYNNGTGFAWSQIILVIVSAISLIVSAISVRISNNAYKLMEKQTKNMDAKKMFVKNQVECITEMITDLRKHTLYFTYIDNNSKIRNFETRIVGIKAFLEDKNQYLPEIMDGKAMYMDYNLLSDLTFINFKDSIFLPREIADELNKFYTGLNYLSGKERIEGKGNIIYFNQGQNLNLANLKHANNNFWANTYPYERNIKTYLNHFLLIQQKSKKWLEDFDINLNIDDIVL